MRENSIKYLTAIRIYFESPVTEEEPGGRYVRPLLDASPLTESTRWQMSFGQEENSCVFSPFTSPLSGKTRAGHGNPDARKIRETLRRVLWKVPGFFFLP